MQARPLWALRLTEIRKSVEWSDAMDRRRICCNHYNLTERCAIKRLASISLVRSSMVHNPSVTRCFISRRHATVNY